MTPIEQTAAAFWSEQVAASPDAVAVITGADRWTYAEFDRSVERIAAGLVARGVHAGTVVAVLLPTSADLLRLLIASAGLGAVVVPMIAGSTAEEVAYVLSHSGAELVVCDPVGAAAVTPAARERLRLGLEDGGAAALAQDGTGRPADLGAGPLDPLAIMYTSGSTGAPKGVVQPSASLATTGHALAQALGLGPQDNVLCTLPLFHTAATHMAWATAVACGGAFTLVDRFGRAAFWEAARLGGATATFLFPSQMAILMTAPQDPRDRDHSLRVCFSHVRNQPFCERFGIDVCPGWAMTETSGMGTVTRPVGGPGPVGAIGRPYPQDAQVAVRDPDGRDVPAGHEGEIWFSHPHAMVRYHADLENTRHTRRDGWVGSGDVGRLDADGVLHYLGRLKNVIKRSGENVAGEEVEFCLMRHPAVEEAVVLGVSDPIRTEEVYAAVCVREGHDVTPEELAGWCAQSLSPWKVPRYVQLQRAPFAKLANGKTRRDQVVAGADPQAAWQAPRVVRA